MTHTDIAAGNTGLAVRNILNSELDELFGTLPGDYISVANIAARNTIPAEYLVAGKKVYVHDTGIVYMWNGATFYEEPLYRSSGLLAPPTYTDTIAIDGKIIVDPITVALCSTDDFSTRPHAYSIAQTSVSIADLTTNYVVADYNAGTPIIKVVTNVALITESDIVPIFTVYRAGTIIHLVNWDSLGLGLVNKVHQSIVKTQRYRRESGLILSESPTRVLTLTAGKIWMGANGVSLDQVTSGTDAITLYSHVGGVWTASNIGAYNNTQYDNGTDLVTLSATSRYAINWVYRGVELDKHWYIVLGTGDYTETQAVNATVPVPPTAISSHAVLVGKVIVQKSVDTAYSIQSAFETQFGLAAPGNHADLTNRDVAGNHAKMIPASDGAAALQWTKTDGTTPVLKANTTTSDVDTLKCFFTADGGFAVKLTAGENLNAGEVVSLIQGGTNGTVLKTPISGNENDMPMGVVYASALLNAEVIVVVSGIAKVLPTAGVTAARGYILIASTTTAGRADQAATAPAAATHFKEIGHWIDTGSGNGVMTRAIIHFN